VTVPPTAAESGWSETPRGGRHSAPSPTGSYLPPLDEDDDVTNLIPRIPGGEPGGQTGDPVAPEALSAEPVAFAEPASHGGGRHAGAEQSPAAAEVGVASAQHAAGEPGTLSAWQLAGEQAMTASAPAVAAENLALAATVVQPAGRHSSSDSSALRLVWIYPDLLSTYGDRGNLIVLARRARLRGVTVEPIQVNSDQPVPRQGDIYLLGGGEDLPQVLAAQRLRADGGLAAAANTGAVVFAVCAGYQLIGSLFGGAQGEPVEGLGILDISSGRGDKRGVGEVVAEVDAALGIGLLTGFENHQGMTTPGPGAQPLARTLAGVGNGDGTEGAYCGRVLGTYLHGPALVRNPDLADLLLSWATGSQLAPLPDTQDAWTSQLRKERLAAVPVGAAVG
jgi:lipid II isoglutaminyl synthase (glutamine-hydrolysing)